MIIKNNRGSDPESPSQNISNNSTLRKEGQENSTVKLNSRVLLGSFANFYDNDCARLAAEQCLDWPDCDSSSPVYKHVQKMLGRPV